MASVKCEKARCSNPLALAGMPKACTILIRTDWTLCTGSPVSMATTRNALATDARLLLEPARRIAMLYTFYRLGRLYVASPMLFMVAMVCASTAVGLRLAGAWLFQV